MYRINLAWRVNSAWRANPAWKGVLDHPLVQYIPLNKDPIVTKTDYPLAGTRFNVRAFNRPEDLRPTLNKFQLDVEILRMINWEKELPIISTNMILNELLYRTNKVLVLAESRPKFMELFTVNKTYFYRDKIYFSVFDEKGRRMPTPTSIFTLD